MSDGVTTVKQTRIRGFCVLPAYIK